MYSPSGKSELIDLAAERLGTQDKIYSNIARLGNTSAASIPIALDEAARSGQVKDGDIVLLVGFGAGLTWVLQYLSGANSDRITEACKVCY